MTEYIKRKDAYDVACAECEAGTFYDIPSKIMALPSADVVERKRGKWETAYLDQVYAGCRPSVIYCSNCHIVSAFKTPFCPNCGADMRGKDNGM